MKRPWNGKFDLILLVAALLICFIWVATVVPSCQAQSSSWPLTWTAPSDNVGVTTYKVFWSAATPDTTGFTAWLNGGGTPATMPAGILAWTNNANNVNGPAPLPPGSAQSYSIVSSFTGGVKYWAMVKSCDLAGNCAYSNFAMRTTQVVDTAPPLVVRDLRTGP